jgi:PRTRC genetic system ParB family protein
MQETASLSRIRPGKNPREFFDEGEMAELAESIRSYGVLQPILVRPAGDAGAYVIIAGERRYRAAKAVFGEDYEMPIVVKDFGEADAEAAALIENVHRAQMSIAEEAKAAKRLLFRNKDDRDETARQLGWSPQKLDARLALTACSDAVLKALTERRILVGHAELLAAEAQCGGALEVWAEVVLFLERIDCPLSANGNMSPRRRVSDPSRCLDVSRRHCPSQRPSPMPWRRG